MEDRSELEGAVVRVLQILHDYMDALILVGGWVPHLHLRSGRAAVSAPRTSLTSEADLLIPGDLRRGHRRPIVEILREAGFEPRGETGVIWAREPSKGGEVIEFLSPLHGPARNRGQPTSLADQPDLRVLSLDHLHVLEEFTETLSIPVSTEDEQLVVRVPTLGAFVVNKANTFHLRGGPDAEMKAAKDLLYLRDIVAAGTRAEAVLEDDLEDIAASGGRSYAAVRRAAYHLRRVAPRYFESVAEILSERDGVEFAAAGGDVEGYLTDVAESVAGWAEPDGEIRR